MDHADKDTCEIGTVTTMQFNLKRPCMIDVSHHDPIPESWENPDGVIEVISKISEGTWYLDETCKKNLEVAKRLELPRTVYHFFRQNDVSRQVDWFLNHCAQLGYFVGGRWMLEDDPCIDVELEQMLNTDVVGAELAHQVDTWCKWVDQATGRKTIVYTGFHYFLYLHSPIYWTYDKTDGKWKWMITTSSKPPEQLLDRDYWVAWIPDDIDATQFLIPSRIPSGVPLKNVKWWQYTDRGQLTGLPTYVDLNMVNPDYRGGGVVIPPTEPPAENRTIQIKITRS